MTAMIASHGRLPPRSIAASRLALQDTPHRALTDTLPVIGAASATRPEPASSVVPGRRWAAPAAGSGLLRADPPPRSRCPSCRPRHPASGQRPVRPERAPRSAVRLATVDSRTHGKRRCPQLVLQAVGVVGHRLGRVHAAAEQPTEPRHDLLPLEPLTPRRVLGAADVLDHDEVAQAQDLADWYTFAHIIDGFGFYLALWLVGRACPLLLRLTLATALAVAREVFENTDFVIDHCREASIALGYRGDSIVNSVGDVLACVVGSLLASRLAGSRVDCSCRRPGRCSRLGSSRRCRLSCSFCSTQTMPSGVAARESEGTPPAKSILRRRPERSRSG